MQQDSQDVIISLLQQIAAQNFTSGHGFLNSTNPSPSSPFFEPPRWAIRVNVLWFTSLLLSLASASFGILVKQRALGLSAEQSDWLIGAELFGPAVNGKGVRSMAAPGTAYDDPVLGVAR